MLVSANNLKSIISTRLGASPGGIDLCQLAHANTEVSTGYRYACYELFPNARCSTGKFAYANNENVYSLSDGSIWSTNFSSSLQASDSLAARLWGAQTNCGATYANLATTESRNSTGINSGCIFAPITVDLLYPDILNAESFNISPQAMHYVKDGIGFAWGCNLSGKLGIGCNSGYACSPMRIIGGITNWKKITGGSSWAVGVTKSGCVYTWGSNNYGQLGDCTNIEKYSPVNPCLTGSNWCDVCATGRCSTFAIDTSGTAWAWGKNYYGQLGVNNATDCCSPRQVLGGNWCKIIGAPYYTMGLRTDGTLWGWGLGSNGILGNGVDTACRVSPTIVAGGISNWVDVALFPSNDTTVAIRTDGSMWTWGSAGASKMLSACGNRSSPGSAEFSGSLQWTSLYSNSWGNSNVFGFKGDGTLWAWGGYDCFALGAGAAGNADQYFCCCGPMMIGNPREAWLKFGSVCQTQFGVTSKVLGY